MTAKIPPRENLDYKIASPIHFVACPICGQVYKITVELYHLDHKDAWRRNGYPVITCNDCKIKGGLHNEM